MRVLVTGGAGFLGSHLADALLARGDEVAVFDRRLRGKALADTQLAKVEAVEGDIHDAAAVAAAAKGCQAIFHCAALVGVAAYSGQPVETMETEEAGLRHVCEAAGGANATVIYASSSAVYGKLGGALEETQAAPDSNYGTAKRSGELYLAGQHRERGLRSVALRIFNMYGPRQDERLAIPRFVRKALAGEPIEIFGDGSQTRDFVYVADVVAAALRLADRAEGHEIVNVCSGRETSIRQVAETVCRLTGSKSAVVTRPVPRERASFEVARSSGSRARLERLTNAATPVTLDAGLQRTIAALRAA